MGLASSLARLPAPNTSAAARVREALALFEEGMEMKRRSLKRTFPAASEAELHAKLLRWLQQQDRS
jgi:signal transduction histidine kinase